MILNLNFYQYFGSFLFPHIFFIIFLVSMMIIVRKKQTLGWRDAQGLKFILLQYELYLERMHKHDQTLGNFRGPSTFCRLLHSHDKPTLTHIHTYIHINVYIQLKIKFKKVLKKKQSNKNSIICKLFFYKAENYKMNILLNLYYIKTISSKPSHPLKAKFKTTTTRFGLPIKLLQDRVLPALSSLCTTSSSSVLQRCINQVQPKSQKTYSRIT